MFFISLTVSHLCDTKGCIRKEHLAVESCSINLSRQGCQGVTLMLRSQGQLTPKKILEVYPCYHGINRPDANGNYLTFSCRKIEVMIQDQASIEFFQTIP
jgi:hypothetical protein